MTKTLMPTLCKMLERLIIHSTFEVYALLGVGGGALSQQGFWADLVPGYKLCSNFG